MRGTDLKKWVVVLTVALAANVVASALIFMELYRQKREAAQIDQKIGEAADLLRRDWEETGTREMASTAYAVLDRLVEARPELRLALIDYDLDLMGSAAKLDWRDYGSWGGRGQPLITVHHLKKALANGASKEEVGRRFDRLILLSSRKMEGTYPEYVEWLREERKNLLQ